ncbi:LytTR family transcriptional regulator DNA-binding domain-containing protein [Flavobacteriaceae bacterium 3-367]
MKKVLILPYHIDKLDDLHHLSEGILEESIYLISKSSQIKTASRTTSLYVKANPIPLEKLKTEHQVDYLIEGNLKQINGEYIIFTRLFKIDTKEELLAFDTLVQIEKWTISVKLIVKNVLNIIDGGESNFLFKDTSDKTKAREYYLRGLYHWHRYTYPEMLLAISLFKKSIKENKSLAVSHSAIADCYSIIGIMGYDNPILAFETGRKFSNRSLVLNNKRSESYVSAAFIDIFFDRNFHQAEINLTQALKLNSENIKAHHASAMNHIHKKQFNKAKHHAEITIREEGLAIPHYAMMIRILIYMKDYVNAKKYITDALKIDKNAHPIIELRGLTNLFLGHIESSIEDFKYCKETEKNNPIYYAYLAFAFAKSGFYAEAMQLENEVRDLDLQQNTGLFNYAIGIIRLGFNQEKEFFKHIERSIRFNLGLLPGEFLCNPIFDTIRNTFKYTSLLHLINLDNSTYKTNQREKPSQIITINTQTSETFEIDPQKILYAEGNDNYSTLYWKNMGTIEKRTLRATLKSIQSQLRGFDYIQRCHKSFIINLNNHLVLYGNSKTSYFKSPDIPIQIPVSRARYKLLKEYIIKQN